MQVSVEKISNIERRLTIEVPANLVEEAYAEQINIIANDKKRTLKGFRPGMAPRSYIEKMFGGAARNEAVSQVIQKSLYAALREQKLMPVSTPRVETKLALPNQPFQFTASFEVLPEIGNIQFSIPTIEKLNVEVKDSDLDLVIKQLSKQYTEWQEVDRPAQVSDRVVIDYYGVFEGQSEEENKVQNFPVELGSNTMLPGFEDGLIGSKAGEGRKLNLTFPENFGIKERADKPVEFVIQVKQVFAADVPALDEAFVKKLGVKSGSMDDLRQQINQSLTQERDRLVKEKLKEQVFSKLIEQNPLDIPTTMIEREAKHIHDEIYPSHQGHDHHQHSEEENAAFHDIAKKRVSLGLLVSEYAKQNNLKADEALVTKRIEEIASVYEHPKEVITWLSSKEQRGSIEAQILEEQVLDKLMEGVPVTEKTSTYAELKGIRG